MMRETIYQDIYNELSPFFPNKWKKIVLYIEYTGDSYSMKFFAKKGLGKYEDCFKLCQNNLQSLMRAFNSIHSFVLPERKKLPKKDLWSTMTIVFEGNSFKSYFDYEDHKNNMLYWESEWMKKYLK